MKPYKLLLGFAVATLTLFNAAAEAQTTMMRVRGTVTGLDGQTLALKTRDGKDVKIKLADNFGVVGVVAASMAQIQPNSFVGIASMKGKDGRQVALEVLVFPESARGSNEGHYPWDLQPESMMTNATVAANVDSNNGRELTLNYKGGQQQIVVPAGIPIVTFSSGDRALLVPGAAVFVPAQVAADGSMSAGRVLVGKDGTKPPM
ncbi:MAG TPA: hypothetical protein VIF38_02975 [Burkholderiales bacterium]|jgi:hypothetical protein